MNITATGYCPECCGFGYFNSGLPGVLAHVHDGRVCSAVERCDACQRYPSDQAAREALEQHLEPGGLSEMLSARGLDCHEQSLAMSAVLPYPAAERTQAMRHHLERVDGLMRLLRRLEFQAPADTVLRQVRQAALATQPSNTWNLQFTGLGLP